MKRIFTSIACAVLIVGCAGASYGTARKNANQVQNGMTISQASAILGIEPTRVTSDFVEWKYGNAQIYNGTIRGAIKYKIKGGVIVDVPEGGIFSDAAEKKYLAELRADFAAKDKLAEERRLLAEERRLRDAEEATRKREKQALEDAARAEKDKKEIAAEIDAAEHSHYTCSDKIICAKAFSLAQIYASEKSDQKI